MRQHGMVLVDVITATVLLGALLLVLQQVQTVQQQQQTRQQWVMDAEWLRHAATLYWAEYGEAPTSMATLMGDAATNLTRPWQQEWQLQLAEHWLELQVSPPTIAQAQWLASQLAGALVRDHTVVIPIWKPLLAELDERYLHRIEQPDSPYLNQMATDLDMQEQQVNDVGELSAETLEAQHFKGKTLTSEQLQTLVLTTNVLYATDVVTPYYSLSELKREMDEYRQLWRQCELQGRC